MKKLLCLVGPTAVGKSAMAIHLAKRFDAEIISADSRQVYKEMSIGTAKPSFEDLATVPHHFVNHVSIHETFSAGMFGDQARQFLNLYFQQHNVVVACGGTGLYFNALLGELDREAVPAHIRLEVNQLFEDGGLELLVDRLMQLDINLISQIEIANPRRVSRALEWVLAGKPERKPSVLPADWQVYWVGLELPREELYNRINQRVDLMVKAGLEEEARQLFPNHHLNALQTVGYQEFFDFFQGNISREQAIEAIKQHTRNYAKRQMTWFRKNKAIQWFLPYDQDGIEAALEPSQGI